MHFQRYSSYTTVRQEGRCFYKASTYTCQGLGPRSLTKESKAVTH